MSTRTARETVLRNGTVVTPSGVLGEGRVRIAGDRVVAVDGGATTAGAGTVVDATGRYVLPGLVDLHGDDVEAHLFPRPGASIDPETALATCERANLAAGITTKFHAIAFEDEPGCDRSVELAREVAGAVADREGRIDERVNTRCELTDPGSASAVVGAVESGVADLVSLMAHVPGRGQFEDAEDFAREYGGGERAAATGRSVERSAERRRSVPERDVEHRAARVARAARAAGLPVASHDDATPEDVESAHRHGVGVCEYPVTMVAARRAARLGVTTVMGAPNLVRGGSLWDNLAAEEALRAGVLDALCSDYHPQSLLSAAFVDTGEPLHERVARVTAAPARAAGLEDRGRIEPGARADLVVVDPDPVPTVERVFVAGREVYRVSGSR